jgi:hypothetical protein
MRIRIKVIALLSGRLLQHARDVGDQRLRRLGRGFAGEAGKLA